MGEGGAPNPDCEPTWRLLVLGAEQAPPPKKKCKLGDKGRGKGSQIGGGLCCGCSAKIQHPGCRRSGDCRPFQTSISQAQLSPFRLNPRGEEDETTPAEGRIRSGVAPVRRRFPDCGSASVLGPCSLSQSSPSQELRAECCCGRPWLQNALPSLARSLPPRLHCSRANTDRPLRW